MCSDPEDPNPSCEGSAHVKTKVGNSVIAGNGIQRGYGRPPAIPCVKCHLINQPTQTIPETWIGSGTPVSPIHYGDWYHGGENDSLRTPDYYTLTPTVSLPALGTLINIAFPLTLDRFGNVYVGVGASIGPEGYATGWSGSLVGGWVLDGPPGELRTERYLSGGGLNIGGGFIFGGTYNTSLGQYGDQSGEVGFYFLLPQFSGTPYYSSQWYDNTSGNPIWR
jgi:hypothetical protein